MFNTGSQRQFWNFSSLEELNILRKQANDKFNRKYSHNNFMCLNSEEEAIIRQGYEEKLRDLCQKFQPPLPNSVIGTALLFFKRLYLHHSVMDVPVEDYMHACLFLACKVDEFNITARQYVSNLEIENRDPDDVAQELLSMELPLMQKLTFHLIVHTPYRQVEGFIIDLKTRCLEVDADKLRSGITSFLNKSLISDVLLIYSPSEVALSAIVASASNLGMNLAMDSFLPNKLLADCSYEVRVALISQLRNIKLMVRQVTSVDETKFSVTNSKLIEIYKALNNLPKCWHWKLAEPLQYDVDSMEGGNFDDDDDDDDDI